MKTLLYSLVCLLCTALIGIPAQAQGGGSTTTGTSRSFNPAISVNGLFLGTYTSDPFILEPAIGHEEEGEGHEEEHEHGGPIATGLQVQETEVQFTSFVDPYLKGDAVFAMHGTSGFELEEGYLTTVGLVPNLTLKVGKFYTDFGKHNLLHTHAFPFVDAPLVNGRILGEEGLNETGISASFLLPAEWYSELTVQLLNGDNELFASPQGSDLTYLGHLKNLWDLTGSTTLELGGSYAAGENEFAKLTQVSGGDLTLKWRPLRRSRDRAVVFQAEYLHARKDDEEDSERVGGLYGLLKVQVSRRWWIQGRYDLFGVPRLEPDRQHRVSGMLAFVPTEFSTFRFQYNLNREAGEDLHQLYAQINFTMGSHPAHSY